MTESAWRELIDELRDRPYQFGVSDGKTPIHRIRFDAGLTDEEVGHCERVFDLRFPPDLRDFLQTALPVSRRFPDWRAGDEDELRDWLERPRRGLLFDVQHNELWLEEWGQKPASLAASIELAGTHIANAPKLIPVFAHRMLPSEPHAPGNPVLSVHQSDLICYGSDLADYLRHEFGLQRPDPAPGKRRPVRFWDSFL